MAIPRGDSWSAPEGDQRETRGRTRGRRSWSAPEGDQRSWSAPEEGNRDCAMHCKNIMRSSCATEGVGVSKSQKDSHLFTLYGPSPIPLSMISTFLGGCFYDERPVIAKRSRWRFLGAIVGLHQRETRGSVRRTTQPGKLILNAA